MNKTIRWQVKSVRYLTGYQLKLTFADGKIKIVDLENQLNRGILEDLKDLDLFRTVKIEYSSIAWDNGADIAPEWLYENGVDVSDASNQEKNPPTTGTHS
jgi:hypothetical protein